jgi:hypothetical protein
VEVLGVNDDRERITVAGIGDRVTVFDALEIVKRTHNLLDAIGDALEVSVSWEIARSGITLFDGPERPATREFVETCSDACRDRFPAFAGIPCSLTYHCRGCSRLVCWRHAGRTDMTGGWCEPCSTR